MKNGVPPACVYLPIEPVASRYTHDLCNNTDGWMPLTLRTHQWRRFIYVDPKTIRRPDIKTGAVLDATTRSIYSMAQMANVCQLIDDDSIMDGDVLYMQDFWTPGLEAVLYCAQLKGIKLRIYAMVHAQSVDCYDFTYNMRSWMRPIELGYSNEMSGLFVASSIHREQLKLAGVTCPIHVVSLPYDEITSWSKYVRNTLASCTQRDAVIYSSRMDLEKQPQFMLKVAKKFLAERPDWEWWVTTSSENLRSYNNPKGVRAVLRYAMVEPRFKVFEGLTKEEYHGKLASARIQFNSSLQDYVSWTLIEALHNGCFVVYPNFRSFPEALPPSCLYEPFNVKSALDSLLTAHHSPKPSERVLNASSLGRRKAAYIAFTNQSREYNVWEHA